MPGRQVGSGDAEWHARKCPCHDTLAEHVAESIATYGDQPGLPDTVAKGTTMQETFFTCRRKADEAMCVAVRDKHGMWSVLHPEGGHGYLDDAHFWLNYTSAAATIVGPVG